MRNFIKIFGFIALVTIIGFSMTACDSGGGNGGGGNSKTITITVPASGTINIQHNGGEDVGSVSVTTSLAAPNNSFTLSFQGSKEITGLTSGTEVTVTISVSKGYIDHEWSNEFGMIGFQTYLH